MTEDISARIVRIERDLEHVRELIEPLPSALQTALERIAVVSERIARHLEESQRSGIRLEEHEREIVELRERQVATCEFCNQVKRTGWLLLTAGGVVTWYFVQLFLEHLRGGH